MKGVIVSSWTDCCKAVIMWLTTDVWLFNVTTAQLSLEEKKVVVSSLQNIF